MSMSISNSGTSYTVLRIKRKATDPPLSSLVIHDGATDEQPGPSSFDSTALASLHGRARKRRDVSRSARGVFRLAETVPDTWLGHGEEAEVLKTRIKSLLDSSSGMNSPLVSAPVPEPPHGPAPMSPILRPPTPGPETCQPAVTVPDPSQLPAATQNSLYGRPHVPTRFAPNSAVSRAKSAQYRVVSRPQAVSRNLDLPPRVITLAELEAARSALVFVDAHAVTDNTGPETSRASLSTEPVDEDMAAFQSMLDDYLRLEGGEQRKPIIKDDEDDEYVYDLYYRDVRTDGIDTSSGGVGALLGYEDFSPTSTPPDSEPEDEADEDSNEEDYYRNDYPEDEDADEDMNDFEDAYSDGEWSRDSRGMASEEEAGGVWNYR